MWLTNLKIAVVEQDVALLTKLLEEVPQTLEKEELKQAVNLLNQAIVIMQGLKDETAISMEKIKHNLNFIENGEKNRTQSAFSISG
jgi:hypothetical protein